MGLSTLSLWATWDLAQVCKGSSAAIKVAEELKGTARSNGILHCFQFCTLRLKTWEHLFTTLAWPEAESQLSYLAGRDYSFGMDYGPGRGEMTSALLNCCQMAVLMAEVRAVTLQTCWDGLKEDLLMLVSTPGSEKLGGTGEKMSSEV